MSGLAPLLAPALIQDLLPLTGHQPEAAALARVIANRLGLSTTDHVLDLHCGAGIVSAALCHGVGAILGIDRSVHHVAAAQSRWARSRCRFAVASPPGFTATAATPWRYTATVWYGCFSHWSDGEIRATLQALNVRFRRLRAVLLAELGSNDKGPADVSGSRSFAQLAALAACSGWLVEPASDDDPTQDPSRFELKLVRAQPDA